MDSKLNDLFAEFGRDYWTFIEFYGEGDDAPNSLLKRIEQKKKEIISLIHSIPIDSLHQTDTIKELPN